SFVFNLTLLLVGTTAELSSRGRLIQDIRMHEEFPLIIDVILYLAQRLNGCSHVAAFCKCCSQVHLFSSKGVDTQNRRR
ncbi:hypothetical protein BDR06DRAFT_205817, partial [Suillus hirtellus]